MHLIAKVISCVKQVVEKNGDVLCFPFIRATTCQFVQRPLFTRKSFLYRNLARYKAAGPLAA